MCLGGGLGAVVGGLLAGGASIGTGFALQCTQQCTDNPGVVFFAISPLAAAAGAFLGAAAGALAGFIVGDQLDARAAPPRIDSDERPFPDDEHALRRRRRASDEAAQVATRSREGTEPLPTLSGHRMSNDLAKVLMCVAATTTCATLDRATLTVSAPAASDTGTMRFADTLTMDDGRGHTFTRETSVELGVVAPIVDRVVQLADDTFLVLGWSAWSGGDRTIHALLVHVDDSGVALLEELRVRRDRRYGEIGVVLAQDAAPRLGILAEGCSDCSAEDSATTLEELYVAMSSDDEGRSVPQHFSSLSDRAEKDRYCPPWTDWCSDARPLSVAWLTIDRGTFRFAD